MPRRVAVGLVLATALFAADCESGPDTWTVLAAPLRSGDAAMFRFAARQSGPHQVILEFAWPIPDVPVRDLVTTAEATTGSVSAPTFDFSWYLLGGGATLAQRNAPQRSTGVVETRTSGLGDGPLRSVGLVFGGFELEAGKEYSLRVVPGPGVAGILQAVPRLVVTYQPTAIRSL